MKDELARLDVIDSPLPDPPNITPGAKEELFVPVTSGKMLPTTDWLALKTFAAASRGTLVVSRFRVVLPPRGTEPPPVRSVPAVTVNVECCIIALVTPPVAMLRVPLVVIGPPVSPAPLPTLVLSLPNE